MTGHLFLRTINEGDAHDILKIRSNAAINQFLQRDPPKNTFEALEFILNIKRKSAKGDIIFFGICLKNNPVIIGTICIWKFSADRKSAELGYELLPEFHRKGIMFEAIKLMVNYGFTNLNLRIIEAFTNKNNDASINLLQKCNFILNKNRSDLKFPENLIFELHKS